MYVRIIGYRSTPIARSAAIVVLLVGHNDLYQPMSRVVPNIIADENITSAITEQCWPSKISSIKKKFPLTIFGDNDKQRADPDTSEIARYRVK